MKQCDSSIDPKKKQNIQNFHNESSLPDDGPMFADFVPPNSFFQGAFHTTSGRSHQWPCSNEVLEIQRKFFSHPQKSGGVFFTWTQYTDCHVPKTCFFSFFGVPRLKQVVISMFWDFMTSYTSNTYIYTWPGSLEQLTVKICRGSATCEVLIIVGLLQGPRLNVCIYIYTRDMIYSYYIYVCYSYICMICNVHLQKPTWQWKITIFDRRYIFKCLFFHCHPLRCPAVKIPSPLARSSCSTPGDGQQAAKNFKGKLTSAIRIGKSSCWYSL